MTTTKWKNYICHSPNKIIYDYGIILPPIDIRSMCNWLNIPIVEVSNPGWAGALKNTNEDDRPIIWVRQEDKEISKRFTIAHELGHLLLHPRNIIYRDMTFAGNHYEEEANDFAINLLMPDWMIYKETRTYGTNIPTLSLKFNVSLASMKYRLTLMAMI